MGGYEFCHIHTIFKAMILATNKHICKSLGGQLLNPFSIFFLGQQVLSKFQPKIAENLEY
jgi:hypothetical protein